MPQKTDLYTILYSYARKQNSPVIEMDVFIPFLEKYAKRICEEKPEWTRWTEETGTRVWVDLNHIAEDGRVTLTSGEEGNRVYLRHYYAEQVKEAYKNADDLSGRPFPDEVSLNLAIPKEQIKPLDISVDLPRFLGELQQELVPIIKLVFPNEHGEALVPAPMIPFTLLEFSLIKIRHYLLHHGNKEYVQHRLAPQMTGKEDYLREILDQILIRPGDCLNDLKGGREAAFYFWAFFCNLIRQDLNQKNELLLEEQGALQAVYIVEVCSNFFKAKAARVKEVELAFKNFELEVEKPPYYFSREAIAKFKDNKGVPLLGQYSQEELDAYIKKRATEPAASDELPDFVFLYTGDGTAWLVKKTKILHLCARLLAEVRPVIIKLISRRWKKLLKEFRREDAMDNDRDFERLIASCIEEYAPVLNVLLRDRKLYLIHEELHSSEKGLSGSLRFFNRDELLPLWTLLMIKRKQLIGDVKLLMPFWYTLPVISGIIAFFMNLGKKKQSRRESPEDSGGRPADPLRELRNAAAEAEAKLIPGGHTIETYLEELISRWGKLVNKQSKDNLVEDVNSLIRDRLRHILRSRKNAAVNQDSLNSITNSIIDSSRGLLKISDQKALYLYVKLYVIKLLTGKVFA
ncbi:MAG: hypothetical protein LBK77_02055 [Spirochaetaceae bacterium]|jgi:hypothetical protein|nr:hypothetical protein [Spirochaetaceae bacterium]